MKILWTIDATGHNDTCIPKLVCVWKNSDQQKRCWLTKEKMDRSTLMKTEWLIAFCCCWWRWWWQVEIWLHVPSYKNKLEEKLFAPVCGKCPFDWENMFIEMRIFRNW